MFSSLNLFQKLPCPERPNCARINCLFGHSPDVTFPPTTPIPIEPETPIAQAPQTTAQSQVASSSRPPPAKAHASVPTKRPIGSPLRDNGAITSPGGEPPRKLQKVGTIRKPTAVPTATTTTSGVPILRVAPAQSLVAVPVRQTMLKNLFDHFTVLYQNITTHNPSLAAEHALRQEEEEYAKSTKLTYRNAVITSIAALKRRELPDSLMHPSVGTAGDIAAREEAQKKLDTFQLKPSHLQPFVLTVEEMNTWGYVTETPPGVGGDQPSEEGRVMDCERCRQPFKVKAMNEADQCLYHWGRAFTKTHNGEKRRVFSCCSRTADQDGCERGPHVFYETKPEDLHRRHAFSFTRQPSEDAKGKDTAYDIVALDCEMIYSTGGMRVARVSVVDSSGKEIFDEFIRMDEGVAVIDFNTRFSGITPENYASAVLTLSSIRKSLDTLINSDTIIIGHALENDLKTLRMLHHKCVDTAVMFPHRAGPPYKRALRDLVKENLGRTIQKGGGTVGHSSVEDSVATLDLVRWRMLNGPKSIPKPKQKQKVAVAATSTAVDGS